jgi:TOMM system kinase/cyclase fusion protein
MEGAGSRGPLVDVAFEDGPRLTGYDLIKPLGAGGYGNVFLAIQLNTGMHVAIKVARLEGDARREARFHRETSLCARLHHPHIVRLIDKGRDGSHVYAVFDYVPGETLRNRIRRTGALSALETGHVMAQILDALDCAHRAGIVHRDLKPDNIMITRTGALDHAMVLDFGISTLVAHARSEPFPTLTMTEEWLGTPSYCAPEQLRGEPPGVSVDLYAWGLIFLECLSGRAAVDGISAAEILHLQLSAQEVPLPPEIGSHALGALLRRALRKNPAARCADATSLLAELNRTRLDDLVGPIAPEDNPVSKPIARTAASARGFVEKRQITVLCCSVGVWPMTPGEPADVEAIELAQRETLSLFNDAATRRGGMLAGTLGGRILVVFGYPYACDTDTRRAAMTAVDLAALARQRGAEMAQQGHACLVVRLGLHNGIGIVAPGEPPSGHTIHLAMRLAERADPGSILLSETAAELLRAFPLLELPDDAPRLDEAPQLRLFTLSGSATETADSLHRLCLGREHELTRMGQAWEQARSGAGRVLVVRGEAGIGKSCLVDSLRSRLAASGAPGWSARCLPEQRNSALAPILSLLRQQIEPRDEQGAADAALHRLQKLLHAAGCDTEQLMPIFCAWLSLPFGPYAPSQASPSLQKQLLLRGLTQWVLSACEQAPLLLVIEDLHWVDPTTAGWLEELEAVARAAPLLLLLTARPVLVVPQGLASEVIDLGRLDDAQAAAIARHTLAPRDVDPSVIEHIVERTDGVPLFIEELSKALALAHLCEREGRWCFRENALLSGVPTTLRDSLISRFDRLGPARTVLQRAATIGREFEFKLLQACRRRAEAPLDESLQALRDAGLIVEFDSGRGRAFMFRHVLIRDIAYDCMLQAQRQIEHRAVGRALEELYPQRLLEEPGLAAHHYAEAGQPARAVEFGVRQLAITQFRSLNEETVAYAQRVKSWVALLPPDRRTEATLDLNGYLTQALMNKHGWAHPEVERTIASSQSLLDSSIGYETEVRHLWALITYHHVASNRAEVRRLSGRLLAMARQRHDDSLLVAACTYRGLAYYSDGDFTSAEQLLTQAIDRYDAQAHAHHARLLGFDTRVWACAGRARVRWSTAHEESSADAEQAVAWGREIGHIPSLCMALLYRGLGLQARGDHDGARREMDELLALCARYGLPAFESYAVIIRCWAQGEIDEADRALEVLWRMGCRYGQPLYRSFAAETLAGQGRWAEAIARIDACLQLIDQLSETAYRAEFHLARARYLRGSGAEPELVAASLQRAADAASLGGKQRTYADACAALRAQETLSRPPDRQCGDVVQL